MNGDQMRLEIIRLRSDEGADVVGTSGNGRGGYVARVYAGRRVLDVYEAEREIDAIAAALRHAESKKAR